MKVLLLGVGMQGKAALYDLVISEDVHEIVATDVDVNALRSHVKENDYSDKVHCMQLDATDSSSIDQVFSEEPDVVIDLLPSTFTARMVGVAVKHGTHLVNTNYTTKEINDLDTSAKANDVTILPEFGLDPGIDLVMLGEALRSLDTVEDVMSYGSGIPEPTAATNPLKYKVSWTFEGVLRSYRRAGSMIRDGRAIQISDREQFAPQHIHEVEIEGVGTLEAFPNGDFLEYAEMLGLDISKLRNLGRFTLRYPGHSALWKKLVDLGLLDDDPVMIEGVPIDRKRYLSEILEPQLQYAPEERDLVILRIDVKGKKEGRNHRLVYQLIDWRNLDTGHSAMSRTVGYTTSIGAQLIGTRKLSKRGILSPLNDVPFDLLTKELERRKISIDVSLYPE